MAKNVYGIESSFKNSYELLQKFLTLYSTAINLEQKKAFLRPKLVEILTYYVLMGYSSETKDYICKNIKAMKKSNLNQINSELQKKGFLHQDKWKNHVKHLDASLVQIKEYLDVESNNMPLFVVTFSK